MTTSAQWVFFKLQLDYWNDNLNGFRGFSSRVESASFIWKYAFIRWSEQLTMLRERSLCKFICIFLSDFLRIRFNTDFVFPFRVGIPSFDCPILGLVSRRHIVDALNVLIWATTLPACLCGEFGDAKIHTRNTCASANKYWNIRNCEIIISFPLIRFSIRPSSRRTAWIYIQCSSANDNNNNRWFISDWSEGIYFFTLWSLSMTLFYDLYDYRMLSFTHRKVHQILKHIVFSQKKAVKKKKCMLTAEMT